MVLNGISYRNRALEAENDDDMYIKVAPDDLEVMTKLCWGQGHDLWPLKGHIMAFKKAKNDKKVF